MDSADVIVKKGDIVIAYGLTGHLARLNTLYAYVHAHDPATKCFTVGQRDGSATVSVPGRNLFFISKFRQYFDRPVDTLPWITDCTAVVTAPGGRKSVVATQRIEAGSLYACPSVRAVLTRAEVAAVEADFAAFATEHMHTLMGRDTPLTVSLQQKYNPALTFIGKVAEPAFWRHPTMCTLTYYDPTAADSLLDLWRRCNGSDLLWFAFWCSKLAHLTPLQVWHVWHLALTYAWPSGDRLILVFGQTLCRMQNPPERLREYQKVFDGLQDAGVDNLAHKCHSHFIVTPAELGPSMKFFVIKTVEPGQPVEMDAHAKAVCNLCDTVLNCLFMEKADADGWFLFYKNILRCLPIRVTQNLEDYINDNIERVNRISGGAVLVRTTPAVHKQPACAHCDKPFVSDSRLLCARCKLTAYCSKPCQTAAWKTHKRECVPKKE